MCGFRQGAGGVGIWERTGELLLAAAVNADVERLLHRTTKKVADDIERLAFNTGIAALIEVVNAATRPTEMTDPTQGGRVHHVAVAARIDERRAEDGVVDATTTENPAHRLMAGCTRSRLKSLSRSFGHGDGVGRTVLHVFKTSSF